MTKDQKIKLVEEYVGIFEKPGVYLMDFKGLNVAEMTTLRRKLREASVSMRVVKNTLVRRALEKSGKENLNEFFIGPVGLVYSGDSVTPARVLTEFIKDSDKGIIKAALVDGTVFNDKEIEAISKLPTKQELHAKVASGLNATLVKLARVLNSIPEKFARTIKSLSEKQSL